MDTCKKYNTETISCFVDKELNPDEYIAIEKHLKTCVKCSNIASEYMNIEGLYQNIVHEKIATIDTASIKDTIMGEVKKEKKSPFVIMPYFYLYFYKISDFFKPQRIYLQMASFAAIIIFSMVYLHDQYVLPSGPSAIVESVSGNLASVMILETQEDQHTIIWYKETDDLTAPI